MAKLLVKTGRDSGLLAIIVNNAPHQEITTMAGFGKFKLTDAIPPEHQPSSEQSQSHEYTQANATGRAGKTKGKGKGKASAKATSQTVESEQVREARESAEAKNAEGSIRDRMVDIGRGNQQAGRQRAK